MYRRHLQTTFSLLAALALLSLPAPAAPLAAAAQAYVDPALVNRLESQVALIVTGHDATGAALAVKAVGGRVTDELWLINAVAALAPAGSVSALAADPRVLSLVENKGVQTSGREGWVSDLPLPTQWDGRPDAQTTGDPMVWNVVNPVAIDVGADKLHATRLRSGEFVRGKGVTIALLDSGVYFDSQVRSSLGDAVAKQFTGQADFVDATCETEPRRNGNARSIGTQRDGYCWLSQLDTKDGYGHGTAVASIIWNNFTDLNTGVSLGIAPAADILSIRVLDNNGMGTYATVIKGIQFAVRQSHRYDVRVLNLSISATATVPYFVDPLNRAVEQAWQSGITVVAAAGNDGAGPGSVTVPGNDPYVITVGAIDQQRTPGYWTDDRIPVWSASGPTGDGFVKPDLIAPGVNIITFMHKDTQNPAGSQRIVQMHPDSATSSSLFRMSGTSMSAAITSGVAALIVQANPKLLPDQIKYRLMASARPATIGAPAQIAYPVFRQGMGRVWAPDAALGEFPARRSGNPGMNLKRDLRYGFLEQSDLAFHYQGPVREAAGSDGQAKLFYISFVDGTILGLGAWSQSMGWMDKGTLSSGKMVWITANSSWPNELIAWSGGVPLPDSQSVDPSGKMIWITSLQSWDSEALWLNGQLNGPVAQLIDPSGRMVWITGRSDWDGGTDWAEIAIDPSGRMVWITALNPDTSLVRTTSWVPIE
jgi:subtilisin family serine protease